MSTDPAALAVTAGSGGDAVVVDRLTKIYGSRAALSDASLAIPHGRITGIVGPNGSGKSTLLGCLVGTERPTAGTITVAGHRAGSEAAKRQISYTPDDLPMPDLLTGGEYLQLVCELEYRSAERSRAVAIAGTFGIADSLDKLVGGYSHGMRRRLQFAAALSSHADILVMDEPFSGLDVEGAYLLRSALADWRDGGRTVVLTVHELQAAQRECDHVVILSQGRTVAAGRPADLVADSAKSLEELVLELSGTLDDVRRNAGDLRELIAG